MRTVLAVILLTLFGAWSAHAMWGRGAAITGGPHTPPPPPSNPVMVQHTSSSNTRYMSFISPWCFYSPIPNGSTQGNAIIQTVTFGSSNTPTGADDVGNTYVIGQNHYDSGDNQSISVLGAFNIAAGARQVKVCFPSDPGQNVQAVVTEFANVTGFDGAGVGTQGSGTTAAPGTLTPTQAGDAVYQATFSIGCPLHLQCQSSYGAVSPGNLPMKLLSADLQDGFAAQYGVYAGGTAPVSPSMTTGTSRGWVSAAVLLKAGATGSVPTGLRIVNLVHESQVYNNANFAGGQVPYPNPTTYQFPSSGNLLIVQYVGGPSGGGTCCNITSLSTPGNTWHALTGFANACCGTNTFYVPNAVTANNLTLTVNWDSTTGDPHLVIYDVAGASTSPFDVSNGNTGQENTTMTLATGYTISPTQANDLIVSIANWDTAIALALEGQRFLSDAFDGTAQVNGPDLIDEQGGIGSYITPNTNAVSFTWDLTPNLVAGVTPPTGPGNWVSMSAAFKGGP